jgi:hypothetical protein
MRGRPHGEHGVRADSCAEGTAGAARGVDQFDWVVAEGVDAAPVEREDRLGTGGDAELATFAVVLGDDEGGPRRWRPKSHGNWTDRHSLFAFRCGTRRETSHRPCGPWRSRARDLLLLTSCRRPDGASAEVPSCSGHGGIGARLPQRVSSVPGPKRRTKPALDPSGEREERQEARRAGSRHRRRPRSPQRGVACACRGSSCLRRDSRG